MLAGGRGTRLGELSKNQPKPMLPVCGRPVVHRVLDHAVGHGFRDFVVALGYKAQIVRDYFDSTQDLEHVTSTDHAGHPPTALPRVLSLDTGTDASKVDRLLALEPHLCKETFILSYCDGLSDIDLNAMLEFHASHGAVMTVAAVHGRERFGVLDLDGSRLSGLREKQIDRNRWINGGVFVVEPEVFDLLHAGQTDWETGAVQNLIAGDQAFAYRHPGWWECVDRPEDLPFVEDAFLAATRGTSA
ncbi:MAG: sugar phosphate nucleotidyltransferase [Pseudomonadota bacterium]|nr:sugar phosphate nucleotidyltransferase [Pseudomonadota bacterium]